MGKSVHIKGVNMLIDRPIDHLAHQQIDEETSHEEEAWIEMERKMDEERNTADNNGGSTDYYKLKREWKEAQDIIEDRKMNFAQGNIFKVAFTFNVGQHDASTEVRELNKIIWFAQRRLNELAQNKK